MHLKATSTSNTLSILRRMCIHYISDVKWKQKCRLFVQRYNIISETRHHKHFPPLKREQQNRTTAFLCIKTGKKWIRIHISAGVCCRQSLQHVYYELLNTQIYIYIYTECTQPQSTIHQKTRTKFFRFLRLYKLDFFKEMNDFADNWISELSTRSSWGKAYQYNMKNSSCSNQSVVN